MILSIISYLSSYFLTSFFSYAFKYVIPLFILSTIILINKAGISIKKSYILSFIFGFIYDLTFTSFFMFNAFIFLFCTYFIRKLNINSFIKYIVFYILFSLIYVLIIYVDVFFNSNTCLINSLCIYFKSLFLNLTYFIITYFMYFLINRIKNKIKS